MLSFMMERGVENGAPTLPVPTPTLERYQSFCTSIAVLTTAAATGIALKCQKLFLCIPKRRHFAEEDRVGFMRCIRFHRLDIRPGAWIVVNHTTRNGLAKPYPRITSIETVKNPVLARYYTSIYGHVVALARELRSKIPHKADRLGLFLPRQMQKPYFPMPLMGLSEFRAALISFYHESEQQESDYTLSAWVTMVEDKKDRWITVYPSPRTEYAEDRLQVLLCWRDYFGEILTDCDPKNHGRSDLTRKLSRI